MSMDRLDNAGQQQQPQGQHVELPPQQQKNDGYDWGRIATGATMAAAATLIAVPTLGVAPIAALGTAFIGGSIGHLTRKKTKASDRREPSPQAAAAAAASPAKKTQKPRKSEAEILAQQVKDQTFQHTLQEAEAKQGKGLANSSS